jgi:CubicO group peptidase (beta-lactamase class C family)
MLDRLAQAVEETSFSGVIRIDEGGTTVLDQAHGLADRAAAVPCRTDTRFGMASGSKGMTALAALALIEAGRLDLATRARDVLGGDLPLIDDAVTVEHLLAHRSGMGDYLDEEESEVNDYILTAPLHVLADTEQFLPQLDGHPQVFSPGERFAYCNGGFVVLALLVERVSGMGFHDFVMERVCGPAGMTDSGFSRSDELPANTALGYLEGFAQRTNVLHLPVRGSGDGGMHTTTADVHRFWTALHEGRIVSPEIVAEAVRRRSEPESAPGYGYGLGFWLHDDAVQLEGYDAGVSFRSRHWAETGTTWTVISNTSEAAWPVWRALEGKTG